LAYKKKGGGRDLCMRGGGGWLFLSQKRIRSPLLVGGGKGFGQKGGTWDIAWGREKKKAASHDYGTV